MTTPSSTPLPDSDQDNADLLVDNYHLRIRYCTDSKTWYAWHDNRWMLDHEGHIVSNYWTSIARQLPKFNGVDQNGNPKPYAHRKYSLSQKGTQAALLLAKRDARIQTEQADFDAHPYELNTPDGVVSLRTGDISPATPYRLHTKRTRFSPDFTAYPHRWLAFLREIFEEDQETIDYVQRLLGLALIGEVTEQIMPFAHGPGGTGKSTFLNTILDITGDYAKPASASLLMRSSNAHPEEIAKLQGVRIVVMLEFNQDDRFNEAKLKSLTGADRLDARHMYKSSFSFAPTHTLFLAGNSKPAISEGGSGLWRRMRRIPFVNECFKQIDRNLLTTLVNKEGPAILAWMIKGTQLYLDEDGLRIPTTIALATAEYEYEEDHLNQFLDEECEIGTGTSYFVSHKHFREAYADWCSSYGYQALGPKRLTQQLTGTKKYGAITVGKLDRNTRGYFGVRLNARVKL